MICLKFEYQINQPPYHPKVNEEQGWYLLVNAQTIQLWVASLGLGLSELIAKGVIPNQPLTKPFRESNWPTMHPFEGVELVFKDDTKCLEQVMITLISTAGQPIYKGDLPAPFTLTMSQQDVRNAFGGPIASKGSAKLPGGLGMRGGWDAYKLSEEIHPNAKVILGYLENLTVNNISFSLIKLDHE